MNDYDMKNQKQSDITATFP